MIGLMELSSFWQWWQQLPLNITPYLFEIGSFRLYYYGLMYVVAFVVIYLLLAYRSKRGEITYGKEQLLQLFTWAATGVLVGGRLGYVVFYNLEYFVQYPLQIIVPVAGGEFVGISGMSYHGGLIGVIVALAWATKKHSLNLWDLSDAIVPAVPLGYMFGRIGNFINGELWGRETDVVWGMYFPNDELGLLRHPSQLYEAFGEGLLLFIVVWLLRNKPWFKHKLLAVYLIGYGIARFSIEYVREPDAHLGFVLGSLTMGQLLTGGMIIAGVAILWFKRNTISKP